MSRCLFLVILLVFCLPAAAFCGQGGYYFGGQVGANLSDSLDVRGPNGKFSLNPDVGSVVSVQGGYDFSDRNPRFAQGRIELELSRRQNALDTIDFAGGEFPADGDLTTLSAMVNFFYESHAMEPLLGYYGVGIGWARTSMDEVSVSGAPLADDSDDVFAYQLGLGLGYQVSDSMTFDLGYRYFATDDPEYEDVRGRKLTVECQNHSIMLGLRYSF